MSFRDGMQTEVKKQLHLSQYKRYKVYEFWQKGQKCVGERFLTDLAYAKQ